MSRFESEAALFMAGKEASVGSLRLHMPAVAESGYSVPATLEADPIDPIRSIVILAPLNPFVRIASLEVNPVIVRPRLSFRVRLARSQVVTALARTTDGRILRAEATVEVVVGGCGFDLPAEEP